MDIIYYAVIGIVILVALILIWLFNSLVTLKNRIENAWSQIDVQLRRRYDLIPNLIETVKGYTKHEKSVFENVSKARAELMSAKGINDKGKANDALSGALKSLFAIAENYPDLKASENFKLLQEELSGTESKIAFARQFYNDNVMAFNTQIQVFPSSIVAGLLAFKLKEYFELDNSKVREPIKVDFK